MSSVQLSSATVAHIIHPDALRGVILARRVKVSDPVARLLSELAFGAVHRDHGQALPAASVRVR